MNDNGRRVREILASIKPLAVEFQKLTGRPLGVTGEIAEHTAVELLGLKFAPPRTKGYDALRGKERIQIKGRARDKARKQLGRLGIIDAKAPCDAVVVVILDADTYEPEEILEAPFTAVRKSLAGPGKARARGQLAVGDFKKIAHRVWPAKPR